MASGSSFLGTKWKAPTFARCTFAVDAWAVGLLIFEMQVGGNAFQIKPESTDLAALTRMLSYVGGPPAASIRAANQWISISSFDTARTLPTGSPVLDVAAQFLCLDPRKRLTAKDALVQLEAIRQAGETANASLEHA